MGGTHMTEDETEQFADDTSAVIVRMAENMGYKDWTLERVQYGIADIVERDNEKNK